MDSLEGLFWFLIIVQVALIIINIVYARSKGYSGFLAFLLSCFIPLLGSLIIIALLPEQRQRYIGSVSNSLNISSEKGFVAKIPNTKKCINCGTEVGEDIFKCPKCKGETFK